MTWGFACEDVLLHEAVVVTRWDMGPSSLFKSTVGHLYNVLSWINWIRVSRRRLEKDGRTCNMCSQVMVPVDLGDGRSDM
jgi:hypothetical protein